MKYVLVNSSEWTYPDRLEYQSAVTELALHSPRNSFATAQVLLYEVPAEAQITVRAEGNLTSLPLDAYELIPVHVEDNPFLEKDVIVNGCPNRWAPFDIYDCVKPLEAHLAPKDGVAGLYLSFAVAENMSPGTYSGAVIIKVASEQITVSASVTVYKATIPKEENLKIVNGYVPEKTALYHHVETGSEEHERLDKEYLKILRRMRQNTLYTNGAHMTGIRDGCYAFDFGEFEKFVEGALRLGYRYFLAPNIGWRESWFKPTINVVVGGVKLPAMSFEAYDYLSQYLKAFRAFLKEKDWLNIVFQPVADEPNNENATEYRALCGMVRKLAPELKLIDAVSYVPIHGALNIWIPLNSEYDKHRKEYESFRSDDDEVWHYVCCGPRSEGYINRFMDYPLLATRYLFWGNYKYGLQGYLHWAANHYQIGQNPFTQNCPEHTNTDSKTILPAGDTHIIYPGRGVPWMSMRLEAHRMSAEDFELLLMLAKKDKVNADALCERCFKSFNHVEYDINAFEKTKIDLYIAASE